MLCSTQTPSLLLLRLFLVQEELLARLESLFVHEEKDLNSKILTMIKALENVEEGPKIYVNEKERIYHEEILFKILHVVEQEIFVTLEVLSLFLCFITDMYKDSGRATNLG